MLTLYYKPSCAYCQSVLGVAEALGISFRLKNISGDQVLKDELSALGGRQQVPFLVDTEKDVQIYESEDIIAYLHEQSSETKEPKTFGGLNVHRTEEVCETRQ